MKCPRCSQAVTGADPTSVQDRGHCLECHRKWQNGELCSLCDKSEAGEPHDEDCPHYGEDE